MRPARGRVKRNQCARSQRLSREIRAFRTMTIDLSVGCSYRVSSPAFLARGWPTRKRTPWLSDAFSHSMSSNRRSRPALVITCQVSPVTDEAGNSVAQTDSYLPPGRRVGTRALCVIIGRERPLPVVVSASPWSAAADAESASARANWKFRRRIPRFQTGTQADGRRKTP